MMASTWMSDSHFRLSLSKEEPVIFFPKRAPDFLSSFQTLRTKTLDQPGLLEFPPTSHPTHQQILLVLPSKYIPTLIDF